MMRQDYLIERKLNTKPTTSAEKLIFLFPESRKQLVDTIFGTFFAVALPKESGDEAHNVKSLIAFISYRLNDDENCIRDFKFILALNKDDNEIFVDFAKRMLCDIEQHGVSLGGSKMMRTMILCCQCYRNL